ncbi:MAG: pyridoxal phosphate-dependent aminotransferase [Thermotaleaceae bacterium]
MNKLSDNALKLEDSLIRKMFDMASKMEDVISFAIGEPDFTTPDNIIEAAYAALKRGETHYTSNMGILPLRQAIAKESKTHRKVELNPENQIMVTGSGMEALMLAMMAIVNPGDEVILSNPYWTNHASQVKMCGGTPKLVNVYEEDGFIFNPEHLRKAVNSKTKAILLNSPANPTGGVAERHVLEEIAAIAKEHDLLIISDEVYRYFVYDGAEFISIASLEGMKDRTIIIDSFSKTYAMTGWRIGYAAACEEIIEKMGKLQENIISCVSTFIQYAALEALEGPQDDLAYMVQKYRERRDLIIDGINAIDGLSCIKPKGAFYAFANITASKMTSEEFALALLKKAKVVVVPGVGFGDAGEGFVRISYATSEENILEGLRRIKSFMEELKLSKSYESCTKAV